MSDLKDALERARGGGPERHHEKSKDQGKLPVRERVARLVDPDSFVEDALLANWEQEGFGADGVVTGMATVGGRPVALMANDPTVKAGSWGPKTVEKIIRIQEQALEHLVPMIYLVDSAGARITDQVQMFPGRRGAGRIFHTEVKLSGVVPQVCVLFGPSAAGGAYIPAFCDVVIMRDGNASMYLGSPRMAEMVIGEKVSLEEMGGARMHTGVSGCGHFLVKSDEEGIDLAKSYLGYFGTNWQEQPPVAPPGEPAAGFPEIPADENKPFDMLELLNALVDADSFLEVHKRWAKELIVGYARIDGRVVGIVANQPKQRGGVLFVDSADKAARFIWTCNAFNVPLLFLADVPGFMIGTQVERQGIIRAGAKMISAVSEATVPKLSVIVRKAYGAGLYAMAGPAFDPDACIALPNAKIAVMGPQAAINAVFYNQLQAIEDDDERARRTEELRAEYSEEIDILHLASELVIDAVVQPGDLRRELVRRFATYASRDRSWPASRSPTRRASTSPSATSSYFPGNWREEPPAAPPAEPARRLPEIPADENKPFDMRELIDALVDADSFLEVHKRWAKELLVGYARLDGRAIGIVANQPKQRGGVLFVDSSDKAARFIWTCNAFNVPLLFLADVPGFMIGTQVERQGIIRAGREDDLRRVRGDGAEDLGDRAQGLRRRALRDGRARPSSPTRASRCPAPRSP